MRGGRMSEALIAAVTALIVGSLVYFVLRSHLTGVDSGIRRVEEQLHQLDVPRLRSEADNLRREFQSLDRDLMSKVDAFKRLSAEETQRARDDVVRLAAQRGVDAAIGHIERASVTRDEFSQLRLAVQRLGGYED